MEIIKYEGFGSAKNKYFFALTQDKEKNTYYMVFSNVTNIAIELQNENNYIDFTENFTTRFITNKNASLKIDFLNKNNALLKMIQLKSKEDYDTIIMVVKDLL